MNFPLINWFSQPEGMRQLVGDLRSGRAGFALRLSLSVAAAGGAVGLMLGAFGVISLMNGGRVDEEHAFTGLALSAVIWCGALAWLWSGFRKWQRTLRSVFGLTALWALTIGVCVTIGHFVRNGEFLIASCIVLSIAVTVAVIATVAYRSIGGRPIHDKAGDIHVLCPNCGYSMVGLDACLCPECGHRCTIDALIAAQDYSALRIIDSVRDQDESAADKTYHAIDANALPALPHGSA